MGLLYGRLKSIEYHISSIIKNFNKMNYVYDTYYTLVRCLPFLQRKTYFFLIERSHFILLLPPFYHTKEINFVFEEQLIAKTELLAIFNVFLPFLSTF